MSEWSDVGRALLGSWPSQVASWGREVIAAYLAEVEARGVSPDGALVAIRSCPAGRQFPPSAPELAGLARHDPSVPTFDEACHLIFDVILRTRVPTTKAIYAPGERDALNREAMLERASRPDVHPLVGAFVGRAGIDRLLHMGVDDPEFGAARRHQLRQQWEAFLEATEGREVASLASGRRRGELGRVDPLAAIEAGR